VPLQKLYHFAYPCRDAEETRRFYEDILGVPLVHCMLAERVPSSGEQAPYAHFFFELGDGKRVSVDEYVDAEALGRVLDVLSRR